MDRQADQFGILVADLEESAARYSRVFEVRRWSCYLYGPETVPDLRYRGAPGTFSMWIALSDSRPQIELIQPVAGPSIYAEWIDAHGLGFHHIGMFTEDIETGALAFEELGYAEIQAGEGYGLSGDGAFRYFDTVADFGVVLELIAVPQRRRPPDMVVEA
jgi:hypothetical protein